MYLITLTQMLTMLLSQQSYDGQIVIFRPIANNPLIHTFIFPSLPYRVHSIQDGRLSAVYKRHIIV